MNKYLKELEKYKEFKDIKDIIDEANKLDELYNKNRYQEMLKHIQTLMIKYFEDTLKWNFSHNEMPQTIEQQYINAHDFLKSQGLKKLVEKSVKISKVLLGENK